MLPLDVASHHQDLRQRLTHTASVRALRLWRQIDPNALDAGWDRVAPQMVALVTAAQVTAARQSAPYMNQVAQYYGGAPSAVVVPEAFGGVTLDGRELGPAMFGAVTTAKTLTGRGVGSGRAFEVASAFLATVVGAAVQDMGRQSDNTLATGKGWTHYVRVVSAGACSRCAILAGKSEYKTAFLRHPRCRCTSWPLEGAGASAVPKGFHDTADDYFESLSKAEQDRVFTKAGAFAIREGADPMKVVNARRGAYGIGYSGHFNAPSVGVNRLQPITIGVKADGTPLRVYATTEGTTARGAFGRQELRLTNDYLKEGRYRRTTRVRLLPEQILRMAGDNPVRARELLTKYGYLT